MRWGYPGNIKKDSSNRLVEWIEIVKKYPGFLLDIPHTAAKLGITLDSFKKLRQDPRITRCACNWALQEGSYYYAFFIEELYYSLLEEDKTYTTLNSSNSQVNRELKADLAACYVCNEFSVNTICDYCYNPVDPSHVALLNSLRPLSFQPEQVCWRCLFTSPRQSYPLILSEDRMIEEIREAINKKWLKEGEINREWLKIIGDYKFQAS